MANPGFTLVHQSSAPGQALDRSATDAWLRPIYALFFLSGAPALIYQLVWQRALFRIFGVNIESVTIVVTAFMLGLGLGSLVGGWFSKRARMPLLPLLAAIEALTAGYGLISLEVFDWAGGIGLGLPLPATAALTLLLVLVPTLLMGATLPLLVGHLAPRLNNTGRSVGLLYYVNTLGAGIACVVSTVVVFPFAGMQAAVWIAAGFNVLVAAAALLVHIHGPEHPGAGALPRPAERLTPCGPSIRFAPILAAAALGGFVSLSFEIFLFRVQSFATGGSASSFALILGAFLIGLASGAREVGTWCAGNLDTVAGRLMNTLMAAGIIATAYLPLLRVMAHSPIATLTWSLLVTALVARAWGMLLPFLAHISVAADSRSGLRVSYLYLANIIGSVLGSIVTGFVLMDQFGIVRTGQGLIALGFACTLFLVLLLPASRLQQRRSYLVAASGLALVGIAAVPVLTQGLLERLQFNRDPMADVPFERVLENRSGIVAVDAIGRVWGHGMYDGRFNTDITNDVNGIVRPYALSLFHPAPKKVLMIGLSSASWAKVLAANPDVEALTIVEINPSYLQIAAERPEVVSVLTDPKVKIVIDDGRRWLRLNPHERFDAIVQNTTWYFRANVTNMLSEGYVRLVAGRLAHGGVFFYNTTSSGRAQRTACLAMPHGARFANHMVVSSEVIEMDFARWRERLMRYRIDGKPLLDPTSSPDMALVEKLMLYQRDLKDPDEPSSVRTIETCAEILKRTQNLATLTDDNMGSEWRHVFGLD